jgi:hypothetical protein
MAAAPEIIRLRSSATCGTCSSSLLPGTFVAWDRPARTATCEACLAGGEEAVTGPVVELNGGSSGRRGLREPIERGE